MTLRFLLPLAVAACAIAPDPVTPPPTAAATDTDTDLEDTAVETTCAQEGEACTGYRDGTSSCCNGRHTCYPQGCYYSL